MGYRLPKIFDPKEKVSGSVALLQILVGSWSSDSAQRNPFPEGITVIYADRAFGSGLACCLGHDNPGNGIRQKARPDPQAPAKAGAQTARRRGKRRPRRFMRRNDGLLPANG
jgi:hypothetical protein